ncbi:hypothetical protein CAC42_6216 [Sphaceloma murrayae]|uniref:F-box domain-containing protein n=1 Tax=Sphaceloma murrayae TaxID=2082308 RepID=A0A2K1QTQ2_9PEZI|nr:hypothetical protein CAC42_6216 [Sphaceloma murrayae]
MAPSDPLTALPPELIQQILSYLLPAHTISHPGPAYYYSTQYPVSWPTVKQRFAPLAPGNSLSALSATCQSLNCAVQAFSHRLLRSWSHIKPYKVLKTPSLEARRDHLSELYSLMRSHCVFCGKKSIRRAILMNELGCCASCDKKEWPGKITRTDAKRKYALRDEHLFTWGEARPDHWPVCRFGKYVVMSNMCLMFLENEVEALGKAVNEEKEKRTGKGVSRGKPMEKREEAKRRRQEVKRAKELKERQEATIKFCLRGMANGQEGARGDLRKILQTVPSKEAFARETARGIGMSLDSIVRSAAEGVPFDHDAWAHARIFPQAEA